MTEYGRVSLRSFKSLSISRRPQKFGFIFGYYQSQINDDFSLLIVDSVIFKKQKQKMNAVFITYNVITRIIF